MQQNRIQTLDEILRWEGDDLNTSPSEPGGASKYGVSVDFLTDYRKAKGLPAATIPNVAALTQEDAEEIYSTTLLNPIRFDELPSGVDYRLADITTNLGMTGGPNLIQLCLGMWPLTGKVDDTTLAKVLAVDAKSLIYALSAAWIARKNLSSNWGPSAITKNGYGHGWTNRNIAATETALAMVGK